MAIITVSRGSYSHGQEVAEKLAGRLGYDLCSREVLLEASQDFNIAEVKLVRALHDAPSILDRFTYGRERYLAYIRAALLERLQRDNVVYHGLAGHFFVRGIPHALRVRLLIDFEDRVRLEAAREKISPEEAAAMLRKDDQERRQWSQSLYGADPWDPALYDLFLHIGRLTMDDAVRIIAETARLDSFKTTAASQKALDDLVLAAKVQARLVDKHPTVEVTADGDLVLIRDRSAKPLDDRTEEEIKRSALGVPGVGRAEVRIKAAVLET